MWTEGCVKIKTRADNRNEIYFVTKCQNLLFCDLNNNRRYDILCGRTFTVENGQYNEFITVVNVKSEVKHRSREHHNEQVEISLFCTGHLIGWIWKCWNLLFQFCHLIGFHCLGGPVFSKRAVTRSRLLPTWDICFHSYVISSFFIAPSCSLLFFEPLGSWWSEM